MDTLCGCFCYLAIEMVVGMPEKDSQSASGPAAWPCTGWSGVFCNLKTQTSESIPKSPAARTRSLSGYKMK